MGTSSLCVCVPEFTNTGRRFISQDYAIYTKVQTDLCYIWFQYWTSSAVSFEESYRPSGLQRRAPDMSDRKQKMEALEMQIREGPQPVVQEGPAPGSFLEFLGPRAEEKMKVFQTTADDVEKSNAYMTPRETAEYLLELGNRELKKDSKLGQEHELDPFQKQRKPPFRMSTRNWISYDTGIIPLSSLSLCIVCFWLDQATSDIVNRSYNFLDFAWSMFNPDSNGSQATVMAAISTMSLLFGILMSIIGIILQMAAEKITPYVTILFFNDTGILVIISFVILSNAFVVQTVLLVSQEARYLPRSAVVTSLLLVLSHMILLFPFMRYLFYFLEPDRVVSNIMMQGLRATANGINNRGKDLHKQQVKATISVEMLLDAASSALKRKDKNITAEIADALCSFTTHYGHYKIHMDVYWFRIPLWIRRNTDFLMLSDEAISDMRQKCVWMEWKVLRQYQVLFNESLLSMKEMCYHIAMNTRIIGEAAAKRHDIHTVDMVIKFFNTFMRASLNAMDVRTCYNVLFQYRKLGQQIVGISMESQNLHTSSKAAEMFAESEIEKRAVRLTKYLRFYGSVAAQMGVIFLVEVIAHDIRIFLSYDSIASSDPAKLSVRRAQVILATFYLLNKGDDHARAIYEEISNEGYRQLWTVAQQLLYVQDKELWEISERGENFLFIPMEQKKKIGVFYHWFENFVSAKGQQHGTRELKMFQRKQELLNFD
ncbi:hypothetical protein PROFUN_11979 [Planoprotostelium fungivorum]|uniref:Uncharacterized protein n=1 Tax=Planoprotostelium fungivorum TaxID=1890364 RepID=A0A2P6N8W0_9EUKA|nr:hypothetical protein PROFUN_11979 [Planoprotostelium fungivorum]